MNVLVDTTYLFPLIEIDITEGWTKEHLHKLTQNYECQLFYGDLSIFELYTKAMKLKIQQNINLSANSIQNGIQSLLNSPRFQKINWYTHLYESEFFLELKMMHKDSIDCILLYLALINCDIFATFDQTLVAKIKKNDTIKKYIAEFNPNFRLWEGDLESEPFLLNT